MLGPGYGRVWGDFEQTGTGNYVGPASGFSVKLGVDVWDKKPLMDGISYVRDIVAFNFFIDETGGAVWRSPNIWTVGNYVHPTAGGAVTGYTTTVVDIDERVTLMDMTSRLSSRNVREQVFVANVAGGLAATAAGFNPYPSGLRRVGGWTDQRFATQEEVQVMADLITVRQAFTYRENGVVIPGNPAIQIDDQVRVYERVAEEGYYHYVKGVDSEWNLEDGTWKYNLTTHWLGETPFDSWAFDPNALAEATKTYLEATGKL